MTRAFSSDAIPARLVPPPASIYEPQDPLFLASIKEKTYFLYDRKESILIVTTFFAKDARMELQEHSDFDWSPDATWEPVADRWAAREGQKLPFVGVPFALLRHQAALGLSPTDLVVVVNLAAHRWKSGDVVYPSNKALAQRTGLSDQTIQRVLKRLVDRGLIQRVPHPRGGRAFDLAPLSEKLLEVI